MCTMRQSVRSSLTLLLLSALCHARDLSLIHDGSVSEQQPALTNRLAQSQPRLRRRQQQQQQRHQRGAADSGETLHYSFKKRNSSTNVEQPMRKKNKGLDGDTMIQRKKTNSQQLSQRKLQKGVDRPKDMTGRQRNNNINAAQVESSSSRYLRVSHMENQPTEVAIDALVQEPRFDFIVAGFPKCGTTTLLKAFAAHDEIDMPLSEKCAIASPGLPDAMVRKKIDETLHELSQDLSVRRALKCPTALYNYKSLMRMEQHSPGAKFVVGLRHPVKMFQSFYNYRVTEIHERNLEEPIPSLEKVLTLNEPWKGVSMDSTRFDLFLMQMAKTSMTFDQMQELTSPYYELAIKPTNSQVFLYTVDQLDDNDEARSEEFRSKMQDFLGLTKPIPPFGHENENHAVGLSGYEETINICDVQWALLRKKLVEQGTKSMAYILGQFIESPDVTVANRDHFMATVKSWGIDPCESFAAVQ